MHSQLFTEDERAEPFPLDKKKKKERKHNANFYTTQTDHSQWCSSFNGFSPLMADVYKKEGLKVLCGLQPVLVSKRSSIKWESCERTSGCLRVLLKCRIRDKDLEIKTQTPLPLITEVWEGNMMSF